MADVTISSLTNRQPNSSAVFPYSEDGTTYNASLNQIIPTGVIVMWSGSIASIPSGWALCNGANGTPDLRSRFIVGAGNTYTQNTSGAGSSGFQTITVAANGHVHSQWDCSCQYYINTQGNSSSTAVNSITSTDVIPPYYALAYIMKL